MHNSALKALFLLALLFTAACTPTPSTTPAAAVIADHQRADSQRVESRSTEKSPAVTSTAAAAVVSTAAPTQTQTTALLASPTAGLSLCSPLQDVALAEIPALVSNPFHPPRPGYDDPHQGVDLAIRQPDTQIALAGRPVQAAFAGQVAMVTQDRFPFGNAVIIETPLDTLPATNALMAQMPTPAPTLPPLSALTCPTAPLPALDSSRRSLYVLYAHLQDPAPLKVEDSVSCGQSIGTVGMSGNALNPHLHFEAKIGPAGLRLESMAHYDASATPAEMSSYCLWSVSGLFQLVDPLALLHSN